MSTKSKKWDKFSTQVVKHIEEYAVQQYGDEGDLAEDYTPEECVAHIKRYVIRHGKNRRPGQDELDLIKIAHYAQMAFAKLGDVNASK